MSRYSSLPHVEGTALESVGTYLTVDGMTYPLLVDGSYDTANGVHLLDIEPDGDWANSLSDEDRKIVMGFVGVVYTKVEQILACIEGGF